MKMKKIIIALLVIMVLLGVMLSLSSCGCETCNGKENIMCETCLGHGKVVCEYCNGDGDCTWSECNNGTISNWEKCDRCDYGTITVPVTWTKFECPNCEGVGFLYTDRICQRCDGWGNCNKCDGTGVKENAATCGNCNGTGRNDCPDC